jgi:hypothetical protein
MEVVAGHIEFARVVRTKKYRDSSTETGSGRLRRRVPYYLRATH